MYCFEHIPKTAGTSINSVFQNYYRDRAFNFPKDSITNIPKHTEMLYGHRAYRTVLLNQYPGVSYLTMVRDPVELVKSHFGHLSRGLSLPHYYRIHLKKMNLKDYVEKQIFKDFDNGMVRRFSNMDFKYGKCSQSHLDVALENLDKYVFIGVQEKFNESVFSLSKILGFDRHPVYIKSNVHVDNTRKCSSKYDEFLASRLEYDIKLYKHCVDKFDKCFDMSRDSEEYLRFLEIQKNVDNIDIGSVCDSSLRKILKARLKKYIV